MSGLDDSAVRLLVVAVADFELLKDELSGQLVDSLKGVSVSVDPVLSRLAVLESDTSDISTSSSCCFMAISAGGLVGLVAS